MGFHWSMHQLTEYFTAISASADEDTAVRVGVERAVEALDAEVGAAQLDDRDRLEGLVGVTADLPVAVVEPVLLRGQPTLELPELGAVHACGANLGSAIGGGMLVARIDDPFSAEERQLLQGMAQVLGLALRNLRALAVERSLREDREREAARRLELLEAVRARQTLLETLLAIQRAISHREPLQSVLDAITTGASNLLGLVGVALVLADPAEPSNLIMAAHHRWPPAATAAALAAAATAMAGDKLIEHDAGDGAEGRLKAVPVLVSGSVAGSLVAVQPDPSDVDEHHASLLAAFAQQISLALTDARTVEAMREAYRDPLTGLPNRALFLERLERSLSDLHRGPLVVLFIDLDRFKAVNDSLGHRAGDELLTEVAARIRETLRAADLAARLGGDEFAVLLDGGSPEDACRVAERIAARVAEPFLISDRTVYIGASIGVAPCTASGGNAAELLSNADVAMYRAKKAGSGRVVVFEPDMLTAVVTQLDLQVDLKNALAGGQFLLNFQPIVQLDTGELYGAEALLRWRHPTRGQVPPDVFIPIAEEIGLITEIGQWVLREAVAELAELRRSAPGLAVSVNFSPREMTDHGFVGTVIDALATAGVPGDSLTVELTESALMTDPALAMRHLRSLKELGVRVSLDDFGTGYSSLSYLRQFPVDQLKIDRAFVAGVCESSEGRALVQAVIDLARALRLQVVAEGIEDAQQRDELVRMGCLLGQGYHLYRPMPTTDLRHLVGTRVLDGAVPR
ncbi:MAG TPA: EAL domain-containing protein [Rugosimonospora sp.]|nr:EAL domain-containing protein [Rugosimonospora sp.]